jgi:tetratricopeptide (TPR) repeat protein
MLVPVIGLVQVGQHSMADRYTYLPQIGLAIGLTWGAKQLFQAWPQRAWWQGVIAAVLLASLMGGTWQQMSFWRDSESLWRHALECTSGNVLAYNNLGLALRDQDRIGEAIAQYEQALKLKPNDVMAHVNLGAAFYQQGRTDEAVAHLQRAVALKPDYAVGQNNLGTVLLAQGRSDEALAHYRKAVELDPEYMDARNNIGVLLYQAGRVPEAIAQWRESLRLQPDDVGALGQLAAILATTAEASLRDGPRAVELAQRAAKLTGGRDPSVLETLSAALAETGRFAEAVETAQRALVLASGRNDTGLADSLRAHIKLYQHNSPYHEVRPPSTSDSDHP